MDDGSFENITPAKKALATGENFYSAEHLNLTLNDKSTRKLLKGKVCSSVRILNQSNQLLDASETDQSQEGRGTKGSRI